LIISAWNVDGRVEWSGRPAFISWPWRWTKTVI